MHSAQLNLLNLQAYYPLEINLKIGFVYDAIHPYIKGGVETRIYKLSRELAKKGHTIYLFGLKYWEGPDEIISDGIHLVGIAKANNLYNQQGKRSILNSILFSLNFYKLFKYDVDVYDCQNFPYLSCFSNKLVSILNKRKMFITWHEVWGNYWYNYSGKIVGTIGKFIEFLCSKITKNNIAVSKMTKSNLMKLGVLEKNIFIVNNGINYNEIDLVLPSTNHYDLVCVGRLIEHKRIDYLIDVVDKLVISNPKITCLIVGDGPDKPKLEEMVKSKKLSNNITFTGSLEKQEAVFAYMKSSKLFIFPSEREGFGIVVLEANACGLPVICTDAPNNASKDLIENEKNGCVVEAGNIEQMADAINKLLDSKEKLKQMSESSKQIAKSYSWEKIADDLILVYLKNS